MDRYQPPEPDPGAIEREVAAIRASHASSYDATLVNAGLDASFVRQWVRNTLRIDGYLAQRFAGVLEPTDDDVEGYRRAHADRAASLTDEQLRATVTAERRTTLVREWIDGLRARATITRAPVQ